MFSENGHVFVNILNVVLANLQVPTSWKMPVVQRIPKKNFSIDDLSTLMGVSFYPLVTRCFRKQSLNESPRTYPIRLRFGSMPSC